MKERLLKRFGLIIISNDLHTRVVIIDAGRTLSQEVKAKALK
ncbi:hypothetical protein Bcell_0174 [Evansella cellulosilytica DSM 2522]|uniref:Uncharacterized protein n=1 Tax=Evansella cellulosilytica (strain ATCC 21833 / DSM 2522 / FERM P-1141 / JCM 9156 / N-4) TaxID=649639 RepID=E6TTC3_EVAC2|nr:hypothetical protein Bcell_0174 [Evansella cellulosilytica DSM 2522]